MSLRHVTITRYITPLREGGSLPAIVEADDYGLYVLKFRGAGQGPKALIAELVAGELGRAAGLPIPEIVFADVHADLARTEPDPEIQELIRSSSQVGGDQGAGSCGLNLALDYLPGSVTFDPLALQPDAALASRIVWFDAFVTNPDRTPRNANMLVWHGKLWLIDHGAALYFHHQWNDAQARSQSPFGAIKDHVLLPFASQLQDADAQMTALLTPERIAEVVALIPEPWLADEAAFADKTAQRQAYADYFARRLQSPRAFAQEAARAHAAHV